MWQWQVPALSHHYRVLSYDLLGHGDSPRPAGPYTMADFVNQLSALVGSQGLTRFALLGFSLGGLIAEAYTLAHPEHVCGLGVLHSAFDRNIAERDAIRLRVQQAKTLGPESTVDAALERWFTPTFAKEHPEVLAQVREWVIANDKDAFAASYHVLAEADAPLAHAIANIACPTLVVTGEQDYGNSPEMAGRMARRIPNAECRILPKLRHMALAEDPAAILAVLSPFLVRVHARSK
jgi:pimeloyl-ACP methyl ester carboxylesterase